MAAEKGDWEREQPEFGGVPARPPAGDGVPAMNDAAALGGAEPGAEWRAPETPAPEGYRNEQVHAVMERLRDAITLRPDGALETKRLSWWGDDRGWVPAVTVHVPDAEHSGQWTGVPKANISAAVDAGLPVENAVDLERPYSRSFSTGLGRGSVYFGAHQMVSRCKISARAFGADPAADLSPLLDAGTPPRVALPTGEIVFVTDVSGPVALVEDPASGERSEVALPGLAGVVYSVAETANPDPELKLGPPPELWAAVDWETVAQTRREPSP